MLQIYIKQNRIKLILDGKKIPYEEIDLSKNQEVREEMRALAGIPDLLPPQIFNGDTYCGVIQNKNVIPLYFFQVILKIVTEFFDLYRVDVNTKFTDNYKIYNLTGSNHNLKNSANYTK